MLRAILIGLSTNRPLRNFAENSPLGQKMSRRFVAGTTVQDAIAATRAVNALGMTVSIDNLGENVTNLEEARASAALYHQILDEITRNQLQANVSVKLTHMGLDVDPKLAVEQVGAIVDHAARINNFVRVDMEGSPHTQRTLDLVYQLHSRNGFRHAVGAVIQSYMRRAESDVRDLISRGIRIRLCKGAYKEPPEIAFQKKSEVDANYVKLSKIMLKSSVYHGLATHDETIIREMMRFADAEKIARDSFEFQMLYGVRRDLQAEIVREGWRMRVYIPFGTEWYPYLMRRLAERPANLLFIIRNALRG